MKKLLDKINEYMNDSERWHEYGLVCFYGIIIFGLVALIPPYYQAIGWGVLIASNWARVLYQELGVERLWKLKGLNRDFWYDGVMRPLGNAILGVLPLLPHWSWLLVIIAVFVITYKWKWFRG